MLLVLVANFSIYLKFEKNGRLGSRFVSNSVTATKNQKKGEKDNI